MRKFTTILFFILVTITTAVVGQTNSWINYSQKYVRVGVSVKGLQKVTFAQLNTAQLGLDAGNVNRLQLFHRGQEVSIISTDNNEVIFYGELNDGASDSLLYRPHSARMNPHYSLYSDEGAYFFTIGGGNGKRAETINQPVDNNLTPVPWHWETIINVLKTQYSNSIAGTDLPVPRQSFMTGGESFVSAAVPTAGTPYNLTLTNRYTTEFISPKLTAMINLRNINGIHNINVNITSSNRTAFTFNNISGYRGFKQTFSDFQPSDITSSNVLPIRFIPQTSSGPFGVAFYQLEFPQQMNMNNQAAKLFTLPETNESKNRVVINNTGTESKTVLNINDLSSIKKIQYTTPSAGNIELMLDRIPNQKLSLYVSRAINEITSVKQADMVSIIPQDYNFIIITSKTLEPAAIEYGKYREKPEGGSHKVLTIDIADLYDNFNYGEPSPLAIREFIRHIVSDNNVNKNLLLVGHASTYPNRINKELVGVHFSGSNPVPSDYYNTVEQVPGIGYPGSDILLGTDLGPNPHRNVPAINIGRLPATDLYQVFNYLEKVKKYEAPNQDLSWRKRALHVSGGGHASEMNSLKNYLSVLTPHVENGFNGGIVNHIYKTIPNNVTYDKLNISDQLNEGVGLVTFYGHGTADLTDYDFGYLSNSNYSFNETNKYPMMYYLGCGVSNFYLGRYDPTPGKTFSVPLSTDWLFTANKGAIAVIANSYDSYPSTGSEYVNELYKQLFNSTSIPSIGQVLRNTAAAIPNGTTDNFRMANIHQNILLGDPAINVVRIANAEFVLEDNKSLFIKSSIPNQVIGNSSNLLLGISMENKGRYERGGSIQAQLKIEYNNNTNSIENISIPYIPNKDSVYVNFPQGNNGRSLNVNDIKRIELNLNPNQNIQEDLYTNNSAYLDINWSKANLLLMYNNDSYALPVILAEFKAAKEINSAYLTWETSEEINSKSFDIERSNDGINWIRIGTVSANNNSNSYKLYNFTDHSPVSGENLYRLKMIDLDESFEYSRIESLVFGSIEYYLAPNPSSDRINIENISNITKVEIRDQNGVKVLDKKFSIDKSDQKSININHLKTGTYFVSVFQTGGTIVLLKLSKF